MISLKSKEEIEVMAEGGRILTRILAQLINKAQPGVTTLALDREAEKLMRAEGGEPSFKMVPNYKFATCLSVNEVVVHGLPGSYKLKVGDILGIDVGLFYQGFHTDMAWTIVIGNRESGIPPKARLARGGRNQEKKFLEVGEEALEKAIEIVRAGNYIGDISQAIQETIEGAGYSVVTNLVGHGIGRELHEDPQIPGFCDRPVEKTPLLKKGMTLAIEVIYNMGGADVLYRDDGWTIATKDGSLSGLFERTVAVTEGKPIVLTP